MTNNDLQDIIQKTKDRATRTPPKHLLFILFGSAHSLNMSIVTEQTKLVTCKPDLIYMNDPRQYTNRNRMVQMAYCPLFVP